jgi:RNA polymerase sigma factor (sigma-70 family)
VEEHLALLSKELGELDSKKRELLFLKFNSGLTYNEIGAMLECKPDTVKKQVSRVLRKLQSKIKKPAIGLFALVTRV